MNTMPPVSTQSTDEQKRKFWGKMIWISALSLVLSICVGSLATVLAMLNAFSKLKEAGAADPSQLAGDISTALYGVIIAVPFACIALLLFIIASIHHRKLSNPIPIRR
jgi:biopolymer transport protein ExbB/TolQ